MIVIITIKFEAINKNRTRKMKREISFSEIIFAIVVKSD
jgi:hypothetical protein